MANMIGVDVLKFEALEEEVKQLTRQINGMEADVSFLNCLRNAGVDNWEGYDFAIEAFNEEMGIEE